MTRNNLGPIERLVRKNKKLALLIVKDQAIQASLGPKCRDEIRQMHDLKKKSKKLRQVKKFKRNKLKKQIILQNQHPRQTRLPFQDILHPQHAPWKKSPTG